MRFSAQSAWRMAPDCWYAAASLGGGSQHFLENGNGVRRVAVRSVLGDELRRLGSVVPGPELRLDDGVDDLLRPFRPLAQVLLVHEDDAAGVVLPDVAGEAQNLADAQRLGRSVERLGDDVAGDLFGGERRRHVGRRQDDKVHLIRRRRADALGDGGEAAVS